MAEEKVKSDQDLNKEQEALSPEELEEVVGAGREQDIKAPQA
jgi:imidazolonepropionase-like amidohydrolase